MSETNKKTIHNGEIDLFRFVFSVCIIISHIGTIFDIFNLKKAAIGVEFFFLVSGYLMAVSAEKMHCVSAKDVVSYTWKYIYKKIRAVLPYFFVIITFQIIMRGCLQHYSIIFLLKDMFESLPSYLFISASGIYFPTATSLGGAWYFSALILGSFILYPFLLRHYEISSGIFFPILGILGIGMLYTLKSGITETNSSFYGIASCGMIRAISELALGVFAFEFAKKLKSIHFTYVGRCLLTIIKYSGYIIAIFYCILYMKKVHSPLVLLLLFFSVAISFSGSTPLIPSGNITCYLGNLSLSIYITHYLVLLTMQYLLGWVIPNSIQIWILISISITCSVFIKCIVDSTSAYLIKHNFIFYKFKTE